MAIHGLALLALALATQNSVEAFSQSDNSAWNARFDELHNDLYTAPLPPALDSSAAPYPWPAVSVFAKTVGRATSVRSTPALASLAAVTGAARRPTTDLPITGASARRAISAATAITHALAGAAAPGRTVAQGGWRSDSARVPEVRPATTARTVCRRATTGVRTRTESSATRRPDRRLSRRRGSVGRRARRQGVAWPLVRRRSGTRL